MSFGDLMQINTRLFEADSIEYERAEAQRNNADQGGE